MLDVTIAWTPWLVSASFVLAAVWLVLQVLTAGEAAAIVSRLETREGPRSAALHNMKTSGNGDGYEDDDEEGQNPETRHLRVHSSSFWVCCSAFD